MAESRRSFLKQSVATVAAASVAGCAPDGSRDTSGQADGGSATRSAPYPLPADTLRAVAEAVLPAELGGERRERAVAAFEQWSEGLEPVAELSHPYLVPEIRYSGPDPRPGWAAQLEGLDKETVSRHGVSFDAIDLPVRRELLARPLGQAGPSLGSPASADHIAVALMAHFFASPVATDLCHGRVIGKQQCRGLEGAGAEPAVLVAGGAP